jgi:hypothetical protein
MAFWKDAVADEGVQEILPDEVANEEGSAG